MGWDKQHLLHDIERAHRPTKFDKKGKSPPPILIKFANWKCSESFQKEIIASNKTGKTKLSVSQMYSKRITQKMEETQKIKAAFKKDTDKRTWKTYIKYPGTFMVKKLDDTKYTEYRFGR